MDKQTDPNVVTPLPPRPVSSEERELIRDWEFLFWAFLLFWLSRLVYLYRLEHIAFHLGLACGFVFCGALDFMMRWVFSPKRQ